MPGLTEWPQPTCSWACSDEETEAQAGEEMCPVVPSWKGLWPQVQGRLQG